MKTIATVCVTLSLLGIVCSIAVFYRQIHRAPRMASKAPAGSGMNVVSPAATNGNMAVRMPLDMRKRLSSRERLQWLEQNGSVPKDADYGDWHLAEKTSWWGKRLDSKRFWKDRPVWSDRSAVEVARRSGRTFPPMPTNDPRYSRISDVDIVSSTGSPETPNINLYGSDREYAFWGDFFRNHPKPPEELDREGTLAAEMYCAPPKGDNIDFWHATAKRMGDRQNYPPEEFTESALFWTYVVTKRSEFQRDLAGGMTTNDPIVSDFLNTLGVDSKLIVDPLSIEQIAQANSWKIAYLKRLKHEGVDESYIDAYLQAWHLSSNDVFPSGQ